MGKHIIIPIADIKPGQEVDVWYQIPFGDSTSERGQGGTFKELTDTELVILAPGERRCAWPLADFTAGTARVEVEVPFEASECVTFGPECAGAVHMHSVGRSRSMPRCEVHRRKRDEYYENSMERYADSAIAPSWFDPSYAGERWNEDD